MTTIDEVKDQAQKQAGELAGRAKGAIVEQIDRRSSEFGTSITTHAQSFRTVGQTLREQGTTGPAQLADEAANRLEQFGTYLSTTDGDTLIADAEAVARKQPMLTLGAGLALGIFAARLLKASASRRYRSYVQDPVAQSPGAYSYGASATYYED